MFVQTIPAMRSMTEELQLPDANLCLAVLTTLPALQKLRADTDILQYLVRWHTVSDPTVWFWLV